VFNLANVNRDRGDYRVADSLYRAALEIWETAWGPENVDVGSLLANYALMHDRQKKFEESVLLHVRVVQIQERAWGLFDPRILSALANHAGALAGLGRAGAAAPVRDRATSIVSRTVATFLSAESRDSVVEAGAWNNLCWFGSLVGASSEALSACERGVAVSGGSITIRDSRGVARAMTGDFPGAIDDFNAFVNSDPEHRHANTRRTWIAELEAGRNPFTEARIMQLLWER
jgi:tetratricopeptide (TPR) repeat protein